MPVLSIHFYATSSEKDERTPEISYIENQTYKNGKPSGYSPLKKNVFKEIVAKTVQEDKDIICDDIIKHHLLYVEWELLNRKVIFIIPKGKRKIKVKSKEIEYNHPALLFCVYNGNVSVFAIEDLTSFNNIQLYYAPFPNIYDHGDVCMGTYDLNEKSNLNETINEVDYWFFESEFNSWHHSRYAETILNDYKEKEWKKEDLVKHNKKLSELIR